MIDSAILKTIRNLQQDVKQKFPNFHVRTLKILTHCSDFTSNVSTFLTTQSETKFTSTIQTLKQTWPPLLRSGSSPLWQAIDQLQTVFFRAKYQSCFWCGEANLYFCFSKRLFFFSSWQHFFRKRSLSWSELFNVMLKDQTEQGKKIVTYISVCAQVQWF